MELTTSIVMLVSAIYGSTSPVITGEKAMALIPESNIVEIKTMNDKPNFQSVVLESYIREYFKDDPALIEVAKCESTFRHFGKNGNVIRGIANKKDVGVMQINEIYHQDAAKKLGFDLYTLEGNVAYAKWLYEKEGLQPWISSSKCWSKSVSEIKTGNILAKAN